MACGTKIIIKKPNHTHVAADITDFGHAVTNIIDDTVLNGMSANWDSSYNTVNNLSAMWAGESPDITGFVRLSGDIMTGGLFTPSLSCNTIYVGANTIFFVNSANQVVNYLNSNDVSIFRNLTSSILDINYLVQANSALNWNYQGTDIKTLTGNWQNTFTSFNTQSSNNNSVYSIVNSNSANWEVATDFNSPPPIGDITPNTGKFSSLEVNNGQYWGITRRFWILPDWNGYGELAAGTLFGSYGNAGESFSFFPSINGGSHTAKVSMGYSSNNGTDVYAAVEVSNVLTGFGNLLLMKSGGMVGIGTSSPLATLHVSGNAIINGTLSADGSTLFNLNKTQIGLSDVDNTSDMDKPVSDATQLLIDNITDALTFSSNWNDIYSVVTANSSIWILSGGSSSDESDPIFTAWAYSNSANFINTFNTVYTNSALNWNYQGTDIKSLTSNWQNTTTVVNTNSALWGTGSSSLSTGDFTFENNVMSLTSDNNLLIANKPGQGVSMASNTFTLLQWNPEISAKDIFASPSRSNWIYVSDSGTYVNNIVDNTHNYIWQFGINGKTMFPNYTFPLARGNAYQCLLDDGNGNLYWSNINSNSASIPISGGTMTGGLSSPFISAGQIFIRGILLNPEAITEVVSHSANWNDVYTTVQTNSSTNWNYQGTDIKSLTSNWENTYSNFSAQSANNLSIYSNVNSNSANWNYQGTDIKSLTSNWDSSYTTSLVNSANWSSVYSNVNSNSANNSSVYSTVNANSASNWNYQGTDIKSLTGNYSSNYTTVQNNSANWNSVYSNTNNNSALFIDTRNTVQSNSSLWLLSGLSVETDPIYTSWANTYSANLYNSSLTVQSNSALNWNYQGTDIKSLTSNWQNTYVNFSTQSANNINLLTVVQTNSAQWAIDTSAETTIQSLTANWQNTYTTVNITSATWTSSNTPQTINFNPTNTQLSISDGNTIALSALRSNLQEVWIGAGAMVPTTLSGASFTTLPLTATGNAIYLDACSFDPASIQYAQFNIILPTNSDKRNIKMKFSWTCATSSVSGNVVWGIQSTSIDDNDLLDKAWGISQEITDSLSANGTYQLSNATAVISPSGNISDNSMLLFRIYRNASSINDTLAINAALLGVKIQYPLNNPLSAIW